MKQPSHMDSWVSLEVKFRACVEAAARRNFLTRSVYMSPDGGPILPRGEEAALFDLNSPLEEVTSLLI